jgi:hypothetical protein
MPCHACGKPSQAAYGPHGERLCASCVQRYESSTSWPVLVVLLILLVGILLL